MTNKIDHAAVLQSTYMQTNCAKETADAAAAYIRQLEELVRTLHSDLAIHDKGLADHRIHALGLKE